MLRNKEVKCGFFILAGAAILFGLLIFIYPDASMWLFAAFVVLAIGVYGIVNLFRYRKIRNLSLYLKKVLSGCRTLDVPENAEGELSLLKNDIYKLVVQLETQAELLQADKQMLADSLSDISHQLKTPMTSMMVMTELLKEEDLPIEKRVEFTNAIHAQLERMEWLLSSLLVISRLDAGTIVLKKETVRAAQLVEKAAAHLIIPMEIRNQTFDVQISADDTLNCDLHWTSEAFSNIIKNCMEHTPEGGRITLKGEEKSLYYGILIEDNGEGISEEDLPHIFERFYKGKNAGKDSVGIGLAMASNIIKMQGGKIEAGRRAEGGSYFSIRMYKRIV